MRDLHLEETGEELPLSHTLAEKTDADVESVDMDETAKTEDSSVVEDVDDDDEDDDVVEEDDDEDDE